MSPLSLDVAILGGGLAGNFLARQLKRRASDVSVGIFEKSTTPGYKVGEALVEIAGHYMIRRLGLTGYLYDQHLPKNGLRFFFDTPERDAELEAMSEIGSVSLPFHPAFQIDRARLEPDLVRMNRASGVQMHLGARVEDLALGEKGAPHRFVARGHDGDRIVESRWIVDATGRAALLARLKNLHVEVTDLQNASVWGRYEGVTDIDSIGSESFCRRVQFTSRQLSTIHFCYPGYWIWFIPLKNGITSVGAVGDHDIIGPETRTPEGFQAFLFSHRAVASLLSEAKQIDCAGFPQLAYASRQLLDGADRWGCTGESGAFPDPFYSPGTDFIAIENDLLTDLIVRDAAGESATAIESRASLFDRFLKFRWEAAMRLYRDLYSVIGSYEILKLKYELDLSAYYNLWVSSYMRDEHLDVDALERQLREQRFVLQSLSNFAALFKQAEAHLVETGRYYEGNLGRFAHGLEHIPFVHEIAQSRPREQVLESTLETFNSVRDGALRLLGRGDEAGQALPITAFLGEHALV